jgi:hypothetical protein
LAAPSASVTKLAVAVRYDALVTETSNFKRYYDMNILMYVYRDQSIEYLHFVDPISQEFARKTQVQVGTFPSNGALINDNDNSSVVP